MILSSGRQSSLLGRSSSAEWMPVEHESSRAESRERERESVRVSDPLVVGRRTRDLLLLLLASVDVLKDFLHAYHMARRYVRRGNER